MDQIKRIFVIARYKENLDWVYNLKGNIVVYNKSENFKYDFPRHDVENFGRETETFIKFIVQYYNQLDDYDSVVFLQGNPFDHSTALKYNLNKIENKLNEYEFLIFNINNKTNEFVFLADKVYNININRDTTNNEYPLIQYYSIIFEENTKDKPITFGAGAQFIVSKKAILSRPKRFYEKIIKLIDNEIDPVGAYILERFWHLIFTHSE